MRPVVPSRVSQGFAKPGRYASHNDQHGPAGHHTGIDFGSAWPIPINGRVVRAILPGKVVISEYNQTMGNWVGVYNYQEKMLVTYWHLQRRAVGVGKWVLAYHVLGRVGSTGNSTAHHLHLQVNNGEAFNYHGHISPYYAMSVWPRDAAREEYERRGGIHPEER